MLRNLDCEKGVNMKRIPSEILVRFEQYYYQFLVAKTLYSDKYESKKQIEDKIKRLYDIRSKELRLSIHIVSEYNDGYYLKERYMRCIDSYNKTKARHQDFVKQENYIEDLLSTFTEHSHDYSYHLPLDLLYKSLIVLFEDNDHAVAFGFFLTYLNSSNYSYELEATINELYDIKPRKILSDYSVYHRLNNILEIIGLQEIDDLVDTPVYTLIATLNIFTKDFIKRLKFEYYDFAVDIRPHLKKTEEQLDDQSKDILLRRNGWLGYGQETLERVGKDYGVTRERIRQKEYNAKKTIRSMLRKYSLLMKDYADWIFYKYKTRHISLSLLEKDFGSLGYLYLITLPSFFPYEYQLSEKHNTIHFRQDDFSSTLESIFNTLPVVIPKQSLDSIVEDIFHFNDKDMVYEVIRERFNYKNSIYVKKGISVSSLILMIIDEEFPLGYSISNDQHYKELCEIFQKKYPGLLSEIKRRKITTSLQNQNYKLVDKGTYVNPLYLPKLHSQLLLSIKQFIDEQGRTYYKDILNHYKNELLPYGTENQYHLKGIIDEHLRDEYYTKRDYISKSNKPPVTYELINLIDNEKGVKDASSILRITNIYSLQHLQNIIANIDDLFILPSGKVVSKQKLSLPPGLIDLMEQTIESTMYSQELPFTTASKVYSQLMIFNEKKMNQLSIIENHNDLMAFLKSYLDNKYIFGMKIISKSNNLKSENDAIMEFLSHLDEFTKPDLDRFINERHLTGINNLLDFFHKISSYFVQVSSEKFIRKTKLNITEEQLNEFIDLLEMVFQTQDKIDTRYFNKYFILPKIHISWNKYSFAGIIRSHLSNSYTVEYTDRRYHRTDFIIKRGSEAL